MASNPPFHMEDQTDEDFFDKLVEEDDDDVAPVKPVVHDQGNDSDGAAKTFENLGIGDSDAAFENSVVGHSGIEMKSEENSGKLGEGLVGGNDQDGGFVVSSSDSGVVDPGNHGVGSEVAVDSSEGKISRIGSLEVKEVGWNAFHADLNGVAAGFGSYSDFFTELGDQSGGDFPGKAYGGDSISEVKPENGIQSDGLNSSVNYTQNQEGQGYDASVVDNNTNEQDLSSSQYWENLYPGWRYDHNTGQWYQVEDYNASAATQGSADADTAAGWTAASDAKAEVSYMQQTTAQSAAGTLAETGATESVSSWNQVSQGNNGYPEHMVFDPQYPGWYYDTIAQEWRSLETYNSSIQSAAQGHENGHASTDSYSHNDSSLYTDYGQAGRYGSQDDGSQVVNGSWGGSYGTTHQQGLDTYTNAVANRSGDHASSVGNKQFDHSYGSSVSVNKDQQNTSNSFGSVPLYNNANHNHMANGAFEVQSFAPSAGISQHFNYSNTKFDEHKSFSNDYAERQKSFSYSQQSFQGGNQQYSSYAPHAGRSSAGRPPHALVTFGFGGKLVVMKDSTPLSSSYGSQNAVQGSVSVLNLMEVVTGSMDSSSTGDYFRALTQQSFPGPLVGGSVGSKDLYKWIDERIACCGSPDMDYRKGERLRLLLSLLKIACQHYGKLRSPFGTDTILKENDIPESAVAKLFASAKTSGKEFNQYGVLSHCLQNFPSEGQIRATASEVQNLLVSGKKKEALQCAQEGQLWGPALVLASQLGEQFYVDTVKQMALRQLVAGSPLRTLCLLIAGQPAEVFSGDSSTSGNPSPFNMSNQPAQFGSKGMLDDWEENLAVITANRTKDDELVIIHLGDSLWKERSEITAAHICYLIAEANFEPYSDTARLCLIGSDHWKFPRTYASPEAIQRTELYEYSKVLGNPQYILLPFQPYKLIYAYMLAEVGKVSESLKYCQAVLKSLKTGRAPEVETWKQLVSSLEDRIKIHQQGGYAANLAPAKLVGKLLNFFDSTAHRVVGGLPPPAPSSSHGTVHGNEYHQPAAQRVSNSQSTMAMSSLVPSASMEPISDWTADSNRIVKPNRSVSEPDIGRSPRQETTSPEAQGKGQVTGGTSRFSRFGFGSQLLQKTVGLVLRPRPGKQAKLGETNKFYYDEKLKRWVEEGAEPPAEETALPPPPTTATFQNGSAEYNLKAALKTEGSPVNANSELRTSSPEQTPGIPPMPPSTNHFSARGRMGVRSRYVDTFNQGGGSSANLFQSPPVPSVKPAFAANAKFFVPAPAPASAPSSNEQTMADIPESSSEDSLAHENPSTSSRSDWSYQSPNHMSPVAMHRFPSTGNISNQAMSPAAMPRFPSAGNIPNQASMANSWDSRRRTASWDGSTGDPLNAPKKGDVRPLGQASGMPPSTFTPNDFSSASPPMKGGSFGDLHEVEL